MTWEIILYSAIGGTIWATLLLGIFGCAYLSNHRHHR